MALKFAAMTLFNDPKVRARQLAKKRIAGWKVYKIARVPAGYDRAYLCIKLTPKPK